MVFRGAIRRGNHKEDRIYIALYNTKHFLTISTCPSARFLHSGSYIRFEATAERHEQVPRLVPISWGADATHGLMAHPSGAFSSYSSTALDQSPIVHMAMFKCRKIVRAMTCERTAHCRGIQFLSMEHVQSWHIIYVFKAEHFCLHAWGISRT